MLKNIRKKLGRDRGRGGDNAPPLPPRNAPRNPPRNQGGSHSGLSLDELAAGRSAPGRQPAENFYAPEEQLLSSRPVKGLTDSEIAAELESMDHTEKVDPVRMRQLMEEQHRRLALSDGQSASSSRAVN